MAKKSKRPPAPRLLGADQRAPMQSLKLKKQRKTSRGK